MFDKLKRFFAAPHDTGGKKSEYDAQVATAALFLEMARIDDMFTDEELDAILSILKEKYGLSQELAEALFEDARQELEKSIDHWQFARLINENYSNEEKLNIIETLWRIVFVDGKMDKYEHYLMNKLAGLLRLSHDQLIEAKLKVLHADG